MTLLCRDLGAADAEGRAQRAANTCSPYGKAAAVRTERRAVGRRPSRQGGRQAPEPGRSSPPSGMALSLFSGRWRDVLSADQPAPSADRTRWRRVLARAGAESPAANVGGRMQFRNYESRSIDCTFTDRRVSIETEVVELRSGGVTLQTSPARQRCLDVATSCPRFCKYLSGGNPFSKDPETGLPTG
jgi:hypothetical protein